MLAIRIPVVTITRDFLMTLATPSKSPTDPTPEGPNGVLPDVVALDELTAGEHGVSSTFTWEQGALLPPWNPWRRSSDASFRPFNRL